MCKPSFIAAAFALTASIAAMPVHAEPTASATATAGNPSTTTTTGSASIGSQSSGAGAGKITFNPFSIALKLFK